MLMFLNCVLSNLLECSRIVCLSSSFLSPTNSGRALAPPAAPSRLVKLTLFLWDMFTFMALMMLSKLFTSHICSPFSASPTLCIMMFVFFSSLSLISSNTILVISSLTPSTAFFACSATISAFSTLTSTTLALSSALSILSSTLFKRVSTCLIAASSLAVLASQLEQCHFTPPYLPASTANSSSDISSHSLCTQRPQVPQLTDFTLPTFRLQRMQGYSGCFGAIFFQSFQWVLAPTTPWQASLACNNKKQQKTKHYIMKEIFACRQQISRHLHLVCSGGLW